MSAHTESLNPIFFSCMVTSLKISSYMCKYLLCGVWILANLCVSVYPSACDTSPTGLRPEEAQGTNIWAGRTELPGYTARDCSIVWLRHRQRSNIKVPLKHLWDDDSAGNLVAATFSITIIISFKHETHIKMFDMFNLWKVLVIRQQLYKCNACNANTQLVSCMSTSPDSNWELG